MAGRADGESRETPARRRFSPLVKLTVAGVAAVVAIGLLIWFVGYQTHGKYLESANDAYLRADTVTVSPKISGYVDQVFVIDNQDVRAGQPLVRIDARDYRAQASQYRAQIDVARANVENVRAEIREQRAMIDQAAAQLAAARADDRFAAGEVARYEPLAASGAETREKLASLRNQAMRAATTVVSQAAALESARRRIGALEAQARQAGAQGEATKAQLEAANVNLGSTVLRAAVDGRIGDKSVRVGQFVSSATRLMSVVPLAGLYVVANFKETQIGAMRPGQPARIKVDAFSGIEFDGHVESISPGTGAQFSILPPQNATGNFTKIVQRVPVRIAIDAGADVRRVLIPGLSVEVTVDTNAAKQDLRRIESDEEARRRETR